MDSPHASAKTTTKGTNQLVLGGEVADGGMRFEAAPVVQADGGTVHRARRRASRVEARDTASPSCSSPRPVTWTTRDMDARPGGAQRAHTLAALAGKTFDDLEARHLADYQAAVPPRVARPRARARRHAARPTSAWSASRRAAIPASSRSCFQYGRYLLIACSRAGRPAGQPAGHLERLAAARRGTASTRCNINTEMNYWPAEVDEPRRVRRAAVRRARGPGGDRRDARRRRTTTRRGWVLHHNFDLWRGTAPINASQPRHLAHRRRVALPAPLGALPVHRRPGVPRAARLSRS